MTPVVRSTLAASVIALLIGFVAISFASVARADSHWRSDSGSNWSDNTWSYNSDSTWTDSSSDEDMNNDTDTSSTDSEDDMDSGTSSTSSTSTLEAPGAESQLYIDMRKLWADHVWWTREYIKDFAASSSLAAQADATRLLKNQEDIGNAVAQYYGTNAGNKLTTLLKTHITEAVDILNDAKAGNTSKFDADVAAWKQNADDIATFLASANPNWSEADLKDMMQTHLTTTLDEATAELKGDHVGSVAAFDKVFDHINMMSDTLSAGIIQQFPDKF